MQTVYYRPQRSGTSDVSNEEFAWDLPTGAIAQTLPRSRVTLANIGARTSGQMSLTAIYLRAGMTVNSITFVTSNTISMSSPTHQWFSLYSSARAKLAVTSDDTTTAWGTFTAKTLNLTSPYLVTASGLHYLGLVVTATTVASLLGITTASAVTGIAPIVSGTSTGSLTDPASAPDPAAALTATSFTPYAYVS